MAKPRWIRKLYFCFIDKESTTTTSAVDKSRLFYIVYLIENLIVLKNGAG